MPGLRARRAISRGLACRAAGLRPLRRSVDALAQAVKELLEKNGERDILRSPFRRHAPESWAKCDGFHVIARRACARQRRESPGQGELLRPGLRRPSAAVRDGPNAEKVRLLLSRTVFWCLVGSPFGSSPLAEQPRRASCEATLYR